MKHIRSTYIIQTPASPVRIDFMPTQHWGNATSMASKTAAATSSRKEADLLQHIASKGLIVLLPCYWFNSTACDLNCSCLDL